MNEANQKGIRTLADFEKLKPGHVSAVREWFRSYKTLEGKALNTFVADGLVFGLDRTLEVIFETNKQYNELMKLSETKKAT